MTERPKHRRTVSPAGTNTQSNVLASDLGIDGVVWHVAELLETAVQVAAVGSVKASFFLQHRTNFFQLPRAKTSVGMQIIL